MFMTFTRMFTDNNDNLMIDWCPPDKDTYLEIYHITALTMML